MQYHIELTATVPTSITDEDEAGAARARLLDPEYVEQLVAEGSVEFTATLVATGVSVEVPDTDETDD